MSDISKKAVDALNRIDRGEALTPDQGALVRPRLVQIADRGAIPFIRSDGIFVIKESYFPDDDGFEYIRSILMSSQRKHEQDRYISSIELYSGGAIGEYGIDYAGDPCADSWEGDDEGGWINPYHKAAPESLYEDSTKRWMVAEAERLRAEGETAETSEDLAFYEEELGQTTFHGNVKGFVSQEERARQNVQKAIKATIDKIIQNPETNDIGFHLKEHIKTGLDCRYTGTCRWRFS